MAEKMMAKGNISYYVYINNETNGFMQLVQLSGVYLIIIYKYPLLERILSNIRYYHETHIECFNL